MLININTALSSPTVLLVPYTRKHVPTYHEWMKDEEIQEATASEPLTIEEEYGMQQSWRQDADKLTFIICLPLSDPVSKIREEDDSPERMLGDVNLFLRIEDTESGQTEIIGEIELMIAEKRRHRNGFGRDSLISFMRYIADHETGILDEYVTKDLFAVQAMSRLGRPCRINWLSVKIGKGNTGSLKLFESLGFRRISDKANYFGEFEMRRELGTGFGNVELRYGSEE